MPVTTIDNQLPVQPVESRASSVILSYDILVQVIDWLRSDHVTLYHLSLVNPTFRDVTATYLYGRVTYSPAYSPVLELKKQDELAVGPSLRHDTHQELKHLRNEQNGFFASARLPHNATLVRRLEVSGPSLWYCLT